jgi:hypothetical protein
MCLARVFEGTGRAFTTAPVESPLPPANFAIAIGAPAHIFQENKVLHNSMVKNDCCVTILTFLYASEVKCEF